MIFRSPLSEFTEYRELEDNIDKKKPCLVSGCIDSAKGYLISELGKKYKKKLIITYNDIRAEELAEDISCFSENVMVYPAKDLLFFKADVQGNLLVKRRMEVVREILTCDKVTVVSSIDAMLELSAAIDEIEESIIKIENGQELQLAETEKKLSAIGYERCDQVEQAGQFAVRGGILDIYAFACEDPVRIELFGDEIDSIRSFDIITQRSIENLNEITIYPAKEIKSRKACSLIEYFDDEDIVILDEPERLLEKATGTIEEFQESALKRIESGMEEEKEIVLINPDTFFDIAKKYRLVSLTGISTKGGPISPKYVCQLLAQSTPSYLGQFELLVSDLNKRKKEGAKVVLFAGSASRAERIAASLSEEGIAAYVGAKEIEEICEGGVLIVPGKLKRGFGYPMISFYVFTESDVFGRKEQKKRKYSSKDGQKITSISSLNVGDYVIHENHGVGIYKGTTKIESSGNERDYIKIVYGDNGVLYVPVTQMDLVQKYVDGDADNKPRLNRLGGAEWQKTKSRVKKAVWEIAQDLVELYANRTKGEGYVYSPDTLWQKEFEEQFPFEETEDQLRAIEDTKADMESSKIMDRLICGDVGFGKTEIAIRAGFKAVQDNKQVAYLVPTTILAQQHYNTFVQRLGDYGLNVELLCRFRTQAEQKKIVEKIKKGKVDIVIGTHRLLSNDVSYKDLGLLIIDEEQRFGVNDKEKIKKMKETVDVLSLTATPIPRTLHMSMIGVRDLSLLKEAPLDRMPIQTYVMEYNEEIAREAITRELARGGQVYYVYNRTETIADITAKIAALVPDANVAFAHGQMRENELEHIMLDFINGDIDVLVSTTIVETGLDISNVNTILIHDADRLGLAQLYQLRGRVGRSNRTAYAFLFYRRGKGLTEKAEKRLSAIREFTELGSGVRIAMKDLEIRGAGNLLGVEQHGNMEAVGYDLYCKLLGNAVKEIKGEKKSDTDFEIAINLSIDAYLPKTYIKNEGQRLGIYRRIAEIESEEEKDDVLDELIDRFGDVPAPVQNLLNIATLKAHARDAYITDITQKDKSFTLELYKNANIQGDKVAGLLDSYKGDLKVAVSDKIIFTYTDQRHNINSIIDIFIVLTQLLENIRQITL